jgi:Cft2 family RNA processing exonuclease/tetratricopeptide (TPR) repeat protein
MSERALPGASDYADAMLTPKNHLFDADLQLASPQLIETGGMRGRVKSWKGAYAVVFHLANEQDEWAVRCFLEDIPEVERRYAAMHEFFTKTRDAMFVETSFVQDGILVGFQAYPIIKMEWVKGDQLNDYIDKCIELGRDYSWLADAFRELCKKMHSYGVAHGDLQNKNIMVIDETSDKTPDRGTEAGSKNRSRYLVLVDYDSFYLPGLEDLSTTIKGVANFCHPMRHAEYNCNIDNFPSIVIYFSLRAAICAPDLWKRYNFDDERMILGEDDFIDPDNSPILKELAQVSDFDKHLITNFRNVCRYGSIDKVPTLEKFITEAMPETVDPFSDFLTQIRTADFKMVALGAGQRVGFSCVLVKFAGQYVLLDCGGPAGGDETPSYLPLISHLAKLPISAVFISHAHRDHVGEIVQWHKALSPNTPFFATEPTRILLRMVLEDQIKIADQEHRAHPFEFADITLVEKSLKVVRAGEPSNSKPQNLRDFIECGDIEFEFRNAGHIIGAAYIILRDRRAAGDFENDGTLVYTGDFNMLNCATTSAPELPRPEPNCWVITEATYGAERLWKYRPSPELDRAFEEAERKFTEKSGEPFEVSNAPTPKTVASLVDQLQEPLNQLPVSIQTLKAYIRNRYQSSTQPDVWMHSIVDAIVSDGENDPVRKFNHERQYELRQLIKEIRRAIANKGVVLIPVFAIGRAQELAYAIEDAVRKGEEHEDGLPNIPVYLSSGMASKIAELEDREDGSLRSFLPTKPGIGAHYLCHITKFPNWYEQVEQDEILDNPPCVIMATPGMLHNGTSYHLACRIGSKSNAEIIFVAFLEEESPGRKALESEKDQEIFVGKGRVLSISCKKSRFSISAHASSEQIVSFVESLEPERVFVLHGDRECTKALVHRLNRSAMGKGKSTARRRPLAQAPRNFDLLLRNGARQSKAKLRAALEPTEFKMQYKGREDMWAALADIESTLRKEFDSSIVTFEVHKASTIDAVSIRLAAKDVQGKPQVRWRLESLLKNKGFVTPESRTEEISRNIVKRWNAIREEFKKFEVRAENVCPIQPLTDGRGAVQYDGFMITYDEGSFKWNEESGLAVEFALAQHLQRCCLKIDRLNDLPVAFVQGWAAWACKYKWGHDSTLLKIGDEPEWVTEARRSGLHAYEIIQSKAGEEGVEQTALSEGVDGWITRFFDALPTEDVEKFSVRFRMKSWDRAATLEITPEKLESELCAGFWTYVDNHSSEHRPSLCLLTRHYWLRCDENTLDILDIDKTRLEDLDQLAGIERLSKSRPENTFVFKPLFVEQQESQREERLDQLILAAETFIESGRSAEEKRTFDEATIEAKNLGNSYVINVLYRFGRMNLNHRRWPEAEAYFKEWLATAKALGDAEEETIALAWLVDVTIELKKFDEAKDYCERWLAIAEQLGKKDELTSPLWRLGQIAANQAHPSEAKAYFERWLALTEELNNKVSEANALSWLVRITVDERHYDEAEAYGERWLTIAEALRDTKSQTKALERLVSITDEQKHYGEADDYGKKLLALAEQQRDDVVKGNALFWLAVTALNRKHEDQAESYATEYLSLSQRLSNKKGEMIALWLLTRTSLEKNRPKAKSHCEAWLNTAEQLDDSMNQMRALDQLITIEFEMNCLADAENHSQRLLKIAEQVGVNAQLMKSLKHLGLIASQRENIEEAVGYFKRWLEIGERIGDKNNVVWALSCLTRTTGKQERYGEADGYCRRLLSIVEEIDDKQWVLTAYYWLVRLGVEQEHYDEAEGYGKKWLALATQLEDKKSEARALSWLIEIAFDQEHFDQAVEYGQRWHDIGEALGGARAKADALYWLGRIAVKQKHADEAEEHFRKSLDIERKLGESIDLVQVLEQLSHLTEAGGRCKEAETYALNALDVLFRLGDHEEETKDIQEDLKRLRSKLATSVIPSAMHSRPSTGEWNHFFDGSSAGAGESSLVRLE